MQDFCTNHITKTRVTSQSPIGLCAKTLSLPIPSSCRRAGPPSSCTEQAHHANHHMHRREKRRMMFYNTAEASFKSPLHLPWDSSKGSPPVPSLLLVRGCCWAVVVPDGYPRWRALLSTSEIHPALGGMQSPWGNLCRTFLPLGLFPDTQREEAAFGRAVRQAKPPC